MGRLKQHLRLSYNKPLLILFMLTAVVQSPLHGQSYLDTLKAVVDSDVRDLVKLEVYFKLHSYSTDSMDIARDFSNGMLPAKKNRE